MSRRRSGGDEGVALLFVVVAIMVLATLSVLALGSIVGQVGPASYQRKSGQTINASQAGMNAALAAIREATYTEDGAVLGDRAKVPCWTGHTGTVQSAQGGTTLTYGVTIRYYKNSPASQSATWLTANALSCVTGLGTLTTPGFALITSQASGTGLPNLPDTSGDRTLQGIYNFSLTNPVLPGGLMRDANGLCYIGGLVAGTGVTIGTCVPGADQQMWSYNASYQLVLVATKAADGTGGLCLAAPPATSSSNPVPVIMRVCDSTDYSQRWGVNPNSPVHFYGHLTKNYGTSWCLGSATVGVAGGSALADTSTCGANNQGIIPDGTVGAGAAGTTLKKDTDVTGQPFQWVNYQEFGRCMDITSWNVNSSMNIVYPCKQDPMNGATSAASPGWNEVFTWNLTTRYFYANVNASSGKPSDPNDPPYCMKSPNSVGGYITFATKCANIPAASLAAYQWTVNRDTGNYATSYTVVDGYGRCMSNGPLYGSYSSIITNTCDGSDGQKWNAPPGFGNANVTGVVEVFPTPPQ